MYKEVCEASLTHFKEKKSDTSTCTLSFARERQCESSVKLISVINQKSGIWEKPFCLSFFDFCYFRNKDHLSIDNGFFGIPRA